ncbi:MAG: F0F1 ATP synthase subunit A [Flavobacteriales bacterium]
MKGLPNTVFLRKVLLSAVIATVCALVPAVLSAQDHGTAPAQDSVAHDQVEAGGHLEAANEGAAHGEAAHAEEKFNAGKLIMEHIGDSHSWHLWGHTSLPLPIILWTDKGMEFFSSSRLMNEHHEPVAYQGAYYTYLLEHEKIKAVDAHGAINEAASVTDLSLTKNAITMIMVAALMLFMFIGMARGYAKRGISAPKGLAKFLEPVILFIRDDVAKNSIGVKHYAKFVPYLLTLFFFIWITNLFGLIPFPPFGGNVTGNIATPLVLALISFFIVTIVANWHYWKHILAMPGVPFAILPLLTVIEIAGHFIRPFVLMVRLFANLMAGHIVLLVFFCLIFIAGEASVAGGYIAAIPAVAFTIFINCLELLVCALQAYVFTLLTAMYIGMAVAEPHHAHAEHH